MNDQPTTPSSSDALPVWREQVAQILRNLTSAEKLQLMGDVARSLRAPVPVAAGWRENLKRLQEKLATLPVHNPADGFSNRDHDQVLYGDGT